MTEQKKELSVEEKTVITSSEQGKEWNYEDKEFINSEDSKEKDDDFKKLVLSNVQDFIYISEHFYSGFWIRMVAFMIDVCIIISLTSLINFITFGKLELGYKIPILNDTLLYILTYHAYFFVLTYLFSQTIGKMIFGIKVEKNNGSKLTLVDTFFREVVGRFLNYALKYVLYLIIPFTDKKKGIHDYIADSVVVKSDFSSLRKKVNKAFKNEN